MTTTVVALPRALPMPHREPRRAGRHRLGLVAIVLGALMVRAALVRRGLWLDETISFIQVDHLSLGAVIARQVNGVHPPLYHVLLREWMAAFGPSPLGLRSLSMAWSVAGILSLWGWSREAFPTANPSVAAALGAFTPFAIWYATEARMYAQLFALTAVTGWLAWSVLGRGASRARVAGLAAAVLGMLFTHYFASLSVATLGLMALVLALTRRELRSRAIAVLTCCALPMLALGAWGMYVLLQRSAEPLTTVFAHPDFFAVMIAGIEMVAGFHPYRSLGIAAAAWPLLCMLAVILVPAMGHLRWRAGGLVMLVCLPTLALIAATLVTPRSVFDSRYLTVCVPPIYVLLSGGWNLLPATRARAFAGSALIVAGIATAVWQNSDPGNPKLYQLRAAVRTVNEYGESGDAVMLVPQVNELNGHDAVLNYYRLAHGMRVV
jgi:uncharacterized membrane protein